MFLNILYDDNKKYTDPLTLRVMSSTTLSITNLNSLQDELIKYNITTDRILSQVDINVKGKVNNINELKNVLSLFENPCLCIGNIGFDNTMDLLNKLNDTNINVRTIYSANEEDNIKNVIKAYKYIAKAKKYILQFDLSPLEQSLLAFDLLKEREYKDSNQKGSISRSLMKVYNSNEIVCLGFSNLYAAILDSLGIKNELLYYKSNNGPGHVNNIVYMNDIKYDVHTSFIVDLSWACNGPYEKRKYKYNYFYKTLENDKQNKRKRDLEIDMEANKNSMFYKIYCESLEMDKYIIKSDYNYLVFKLQLYKLLKEIVKYSDIVGNYLYMDEINYYLNNHDEDDEEMCEGIYLLIAEFVEFEFSKQMKFTTLYELLGNELRTLISIDNEKYAFEVEDVLSNYKYSKESEETFYNGFDSKKITKVKKMKNPLLPQDL